MDASGKSAGAARRTALVCALSLWAAAWVSVTHATAQRTFVSANGSDAALCNLAAPCRSFGAAVAQTNDGGEVIVLDSAGYGPVSLAKSVSLIAPAGVYAGISVFSGAGITVATPGLKITLRGLTINGQGGSYGISVTANSDVHVQRCIVSGMTSAGLWVYEAGGAVVVEDSTFTDNGGYGIDNQGSYMTIARTTINRNQDGGLAVLGALGPPSVASVVDTTIELNYGWGIAISGNNLNTATVAAEHVMIHGNSYDGIAAQFAGELMAAGIVVDGNGTYGVSVTTQAVATLVDATIRRNGGVGLWASNSGSRVLLNRSQVVDNAGGGVKIDFGGVVQTLTTNAIVNNAAPNLTGVLTPVSAQ